MGGVGEAIFFTDKRMRRFHFHVRFVQWPFGQYFYVHVTICPGGGHPFVQPLCECSSTQANFTSRPALFNSKCWCESRKNCLKRDSNPSQPACQASMLTRWSRKQKTKIWFESKISEIWSVLRLFRYIFETNKSFVWVCFSVSDVYQNNWNKQICFKKNQNKPKIYMETTKRNSFVSKWTETNWKCTSKQLKKTVLFQNDPKKPKISLIQKFVLILICELLIQNFHKLLTPIRPTSYQNDNKTNEAWGTLKNGKTFAK